MAIKLSKDDLKRREFRLEFPDDLEFDDPAFGDELGALPEEPDA